MEDKTLDKQIDLLIKAHANSVRTGYVVHPTMSVLSTSNTKFQLKKLFKSELDKAVKVARIDEHYYIEWYPDQAKWIVVEADRIKELSQPTNQVSETK
jgi:hypothetical protein